MDESCSSIKCSKSSCKTVIAPTRKLTHLEKYSRSILPGEVPEAWLSWQRRFICACRKLVSCVHRESHSELQFHDKSRNRASHLDQLNRSAIFRWSLDLKAGNIEAHLETSSSKFRKRTMMSLLRSFLWTTKTHGQNWWCFPSACYRQTKERGKSRTCHPKKSFVTDSFVHRRSVFDCTGENGRHPPNRIGRNPQTANEQMRMN